MMPLVDSGHCYLDILKLIMEMNLALGKYLKVRKNGVLSLMLMRVPCILLNQFYLRNLIHMIHVIMPCMVLNKTVSFER